MIEVDVPAGTAAKRVQNVVRVFGAESGEHDPALVGLAVAVGVFHEQQLGGVGDVRSVAGRKDAGRYQQAVGEDGRLVGLAISRRVFENDDLVVRDLARLELRIDAARRDPQPASRIPVRVNRFRNVGIGREQVDLEPFSDLELLQLLHRIGIGNVRQIPLGEGGRGREHD